MRHEPRATCSETRARRLRSGDLITDRPTGRGSSTIFPQLHALARFYATPEGAAVMGKLLTFTDAVTPAIVAAVSAWGRELDARLRALSSSGALTPPKEDPR